MDEISKRDLLTQTGISYGQLYRWKREGLIPEEWFVKRSAFTGQETWFPRGRILERVRMILEMKDGQSLDEIRRQITGTDDGELDALTLEAAMAAEQDGASATAILFETKYGNHFILLTKDKRALSDNGVRVLKVLKERELRKHMKAPDAEKDETFEHAEAADAENENPLESAGTADTEDNGGK